MDVQKSWARGGRRSWVHVNDIKAIRDENIFSSQTYCNIHHRLLLASVVSYAVILHIIIFLFLYPHSISLILPQQNKPDDEPPLVSNLDLECKSFIICIIRILNLTIFYGWLILLNVSVYVGYTGRFEWNWVCKFLTNIGSYMNQ